MNTAKNQFIILMAFFMSLVALTIDAMLPALGDIRNSLAVVGPNDTQLIISFVFLGMASGMMFYGPISDSWGRKNTLFLGMVIYMIGCLFSLFSESLQLMLIGRILQGFGSAACRVVPLAMIRDRFSGVEMGKVMSLIMVFFVIVPALAPLIGQVILYFSDWRAIFALFILLSVIGSLFLNFKQEETLPLTKRIPFTVKAISSGIKETLTNKTSRAYMLAAGLTFGAFIAYLSSSQQILQVQYKVGDKFSIYFGGLALCIGFSSYVNSRLVGKYGMAPLSKVALLALGINSILYLLLMISSNGQTSLFLFMTYLAISFLFIGLLFSNLNTLAIEPLGHIAGVANSVISSIQTFISVIIGAFVGQMYDGNVYPLVASFLVLSLLSLLVIKIIIK